MERLASFWIVIACPPVLGFGEFWRRNPLSCKSPMGRDKRSNQVPAPKRRASLMKTPQKPRHLEGSEGAHTDCRRLT